MDRCNFAGVKKPRLTQAMRLLILQTALHGTRHGAMSEFARSLGVKVKRLENVLADRVALSGPLTDIIVRQHPGISADWLRYGNEAGLTQHWLERLREAEKRLERERTERGGR